MGGSPHEAAGAYVATSGNAQARAPACRRGASSAGGGVAYVVVRVGVNVVVRAVSAALVAIPARSVLVFSRSLFIVDVVVVVERGAVGGTVGVHVLAKIVVWLPIRVARVLV